MGEEQAVSCLAILDRGCGKKTMMPLQIADPGVTPTETWHEVLQSPLSQGFRGAVNDLKGDVGHIGVHPTPLPPSNNVDRMWFFWDPIAFCGGMLVALMVAVVHSSGCIDPGTGIGLPSGMPQAPGRGGGDNGHSSLNLSLSFARLVSTFSLCAALFLSRSSVRALLSISLWRSWRSSISVSSSAAS